MDNLNSIDIIAEIAQGYEGKPEQALLLARAGVASNADAIKFHCVYADDTAVPKYKHYKFFKTLEMPESVWQELHAVIRDGGKKLILNLGGERSLQLAKKIGVSTVKYHATHFFCTDLIRRSLQEFSKVYISIGGISPEEIEWFINTHSLTARSNIAFTYGFQSSPTPIDKNNLRKIVALQQRFPGFDFGFEDHADAFGEDRFNVSLVALGLGITHLEKHLTLDPYLKLEDAESALSITDFCKYVETIRRLQSCLGAANLELTDIEHDYRGRVLKVVVTAEDLAAGTELRPEHLALKRPTEYHLGAYLKVGDLCGRRLAVNIAANSVIINELLV
jgi:N,N'-diacetyllegionaminate synthase